MIRTAAATSDAIEDELAEEFRPIIGEVLADLKLTLNRREQFALEKVLIDELLGLGPLEELLADPDVSDIMVNGPDQTYIEKKGKLQIAPIQFRDEQHLFQIAQRICNSVGRRVDQTTPLADARLKDGSREVNVIVPPLSLKGTAISIRKFSAKPITLDMMAKGGSMNEKMATALKIAGACRFNVVISGGTGSGKTTMLNAMSKMIDPGERVITIEDAAELRLQQPHVLPLETRPANLEGQGQISIRDLVINALRMRPDRIILGEIRGSECFDMLAAMNTGHDGSMCTLHSNSPREALARMENMVMMSDIKVPKEVISRQIADSIDLIVQVRRLRDGSRRVTSITEVIGMEGPVIITQELFKFEYLDEGADRPRSGAEYRRQLWACGRTRSTRPSSSASTRPTSRPASKNCARSTDRCFRLAPMRGPVQLSAMSIRSALLIAALVVAAPLSARAGKADDNASPRRRRKRQQLLAGLRRARPISPP